MNPLSLETTTNNLHFIACNPLTDIFHGGDLDSNNRVSSGQPFIVYDLDDQFVNDLVYSSHSMDEDGDMTFTPHEFAWSVYFNEVDIDEVVSTINNFDFLIVTKIKHPTEDKWAIPVNSAVFDAMPEGSDKDFLTAKAAASISEGRRFDTATMITDGWV